MICEQDGFGLGGGGAHQKPLSSPGGIYGPLLAPPGVLTSNEAVIEASGTRDRRENGVLKGRRRIREQAGRCDGLSNESSCRSPTPGKD